METKLQGMETWGTIKPKYDSLGLIYLIRNVTHRRDDTAHEIIGIVRADKDLIFLHQKEHISLTQYLAEFNARTEVVTGAGGKPGQHPAAMNLVGADKCLEVDSLATEQSKEKRG